MTETESNYRIRVAWNPIYGHDYYYPQEKLFGFFWTDMNSCSTLEKAKAYIDLTILREEKEGQPNRYIDYP